jgi:hypothetical protein
MISSLSASSLLRREPQTSFGSGFNLQGTYATEPKSIPFSPVTTTQRPLLQVEGANTGGIVTEAMRASMPQFAAKVDSPSSNLLKVAQHAAQSLYQTVTRQSQANQPQLLLSA